MHSYFLSRIKLLMHSHFNLSSDKSEFKGHEHIYGSIDVIEYSGHLHYFLLDYKILYGGHFSQMSELA